MGGPDGKLLWTKTQVADQLGVSIKTVSRLIESGQLPFVRIGRSVRIEMQAVHHFVETLRDYNEPCVGSAVQGASTCHINAKEVRTGGHRLSMQAERELDALLEPPTVGKRKPSKQS
jgi:excisionase family DNA binding protein